LTSLLADATDLAMNVVTHAARFALDRSVVSRLNVTAASSEPSSLLETGGAARFTKFEPHTLPPNRNLNCYRTATVNECPSDVGKHPGLAFLQRCAVVAPLQPETAGDSRSHSGENLSAKRRDWVRLPAPLLRTDGTWALGPSTARRTSWCDDD